MSAAAPLHLAQRPVSAALSPVTLDDMAPLREVYANSVDEVDAIEQKIVEAFARDCGAPMPAEVRGRIVALRLLLQLGASHVESIAALVRAHGSRAR